MVYQEFDNILHRMEKHYKGKFAWNGFEGLKVTVIHKSGRDRSLTGGAAYESFWLQS